MLVLSAITPVQAVVTVTYYHTDALGSVVAASDESGNPLWSESYRPYGERQENFVSTDEHALFYTGKPHDDDTGLSYFGARYYNPTIGRFMGVDPAGFQDSNVHSFNKYAYANNNPYKYVDPDGELPILLLAFVAYDFYSSYQESGNIGDAAKAAVLGIINPFKKIKTTVNIAKKFKVTKGANSSANGLKLQKQLASQEQLGQLSKGGGTVISQPAKQANRIAAQTGRNPANIQKVSSSAKPVKDGTQIQTHSFRDASTNELIEPKTIIGD